MMLKYAGSPNSGGAGHPTDSWPDRLMLYNIEFNCQTWTGLMNTVNVNGFPVDMWALERKEESRWRTGDGEKHSRTGKTW